MTKLNQKVLEFCKNNKWWLLTLVLMFVVSLLAPSQLVAALLGVCASLIAMIADKLKV